jgi:hypothetical protein
MSDEKHPFELLIAELSIGDFELLAEVFNIHHGRFEGSGYGGHSCREAPYNWTREHADDIAACRLFHPNSFDDALRAISHQANAEAAHDPKFHETSLLEGWRLEAGRNTAKLGAIRLAELKEQMGLGKKQKTSFGRAAINLIAVWGEMLSVAGSVINQPMPREEFCRRYPGSVRGQDVATLSTPIIEIYGSLTPW